MGDLAALWSDPYEIRTLVCAMTSVGLMLSSAEWLTPASKLARWNLLGAGSFGDSAAERMWRSAGLRIVIAVRFVCGAAFLISAVDGSPGRAAGLAFLTAGLLTLPLRASDPVGVFSGMDGAEHVMTSVTLALGASYFIDSRFAVEAALVFVAGQAILEYASAGWIKLRDARAWVSGTSLQRVFSHTHYGHPGVAAVVRRHPVMARTMAVGVIAIEVAVPFALVLPPPFAELVLLAPLAFHLTAAFTMGLNTFVFAFAATYPAIIHTRNLLLF